MSDVLQTTFWTTFSSHVFIYILILVLPAFVPKGRDDEEFILVMAWCRSVNDQVLRHHVVSLDDTKMIFLTLTIEIYVHAQEMLDIHFIVISVYDAFHSVLSSFK